MSTGDKSIPEVQHGFVPKTPSSGMLRRHALVPILARVGRQGRFSPVEEP